MTTTNTDLFKKAAEAAHVLRSINHSLRQKIIRYIESHPECSVTDITKHCKQEQPTISTHLRHLRANGLVTVTDDGKFNRYSVNSPVLSVILQSCGSIAAIAKENAVSFNDNE